MTAPCRHSEHYPDLQARRAGVLEVLRRQPPPLYLAAQEIIAARFTRLQASLRQHWPAHAIAYSFKTNLQAARQGPFLQLGAWAEVVSGREYACARQLGYPGERIVFNGPYKTDAELMTALTDGALVFLNDPDELDRLRRLVTGAEQPQPIGLRLHTTVTGKKPSRFGFSIEQGEAAAAVRALADSPGLELRGLHMHLFSDSDDPAEYREACGNLRAFLQRCPALRRDQLTLLDLGGGFPAHTPKPRGRKTWNPPPIEDYVAAISAGLAGAFAAGPRPLLLLEPGRYLVSDAVVFIQQVLRVQQTRNGQSLTCNGSQMMVPMTRYAPPLLRGFAPELDERPGPRVPTEIFGASCREDDVLYRGPFPRMQAGDYLVHYAVGAYNASLCPDFIFAKPPLLWL